MSDITKNMAAGQLFIVATPIGNLQDMSARAIQVLKDVDLIAAEDTRHSKKLLQYFGIATRLTSYHNFNETQKTEELIKLLQQGKSIAIISDAGTPMISDPGYALVHRAQELKITVVPIPGACALITALSASGLPTDEFRFMGFLPAKSSARINALMKVQKETCTLIFYESCHRIQDSLNDMISIFGDQRQAVIARELTKLYETIYADNLLNIVNFLNNYDEQRKGEFVVMLAGEPAPFCATQITIDVDDLLKSLLSELSVNTTAKLAASLSGINKNELYKKALDIKTKL